MMRKPPGHTGALRLRAFGCIPVAAAIILVLAVTLNAQLLDANHPEIFWRTMETEHFIIHFYEGTERTANTIAKIAEDIHPKITGLYGYAPDTKFHFIIKDTDDYANGAAYYYNNKMLIWCTALDFELRGTYNWLRSVITHEYTHIIQLGAARKMPRWLPAIYFQMLDYEEEKRPDVLYGYPNLLASYPAFSGTIIPMWFAEGTAQLNVPEYRYEYWDSHRDMQLRIRALNDSLLPLNELEVFGKNSLGNEGVYNHGFSLVRYIAEAYGPDALSDITRAMKKVPRYDFSSAVKEALGIGGDQLYDEWKNATTGDYRRRTRTIRENIVRGDEFERGGYATLYPMFSPDGETVYFSSNRGADYMSQRSIYAKPVTRGKAKVIAKGISSPFTLTPDGRWMAFSEIVRQPNESYYSDLFLLDIETRKKVRLTKGARVMEPAISNDGRSIACIVNHDGTKDLAILPLPPREEWKNIKPIPADSLRRLTDFADGTRCFKPRFSADGEWILYTRGRDLGRDIVLARSDGGGERILAGGAGDQRDPSYGPDGKWVYFAADETGIYNLYRVPVEGGRREALTNVAGGAFMPNVAEDGAVVYSEYTEHGFEARILRDPEPVDPDAMTYDRDYIENLPQIDYDDAEVDTLASRRYANPFEQLFFVPRIAFDYGTFKPGTYIYSSDFLERIMLFTGFDINHKGEFDAIAFLDFHALRPTIFLEGYYLKRVDDQRFDDPLVIAGERPGPDGEPVPIFDTYGVDYRFVLIEVDGGARMRISTPIELELRGAWSRYQAFLKFEDLTTFHYTYFLGRYIQARLDFDFTIPAVRGNVHPHDGWAAQVTAAYEDNKFIEGFEVDDAAFTLQEVYSPYRYWRFETDLTAWYNPFGGLVLQPRLRAGYLDKQVDPFMHLYAGGLHGMRGYSFYSLGGTRKLISSLAVRHQIWAPARPRFGWLHFDGLYGALFADVGDAWRERDFDYESLKVDAGLELRAKFYSWYNYPTAVTFSAARGFDKLSVTENDNTTVYEPGWRYYITVLFDFETIFPSKRMARR